MKICLAVSRPETGTANLESGDLKEREVGICNVVEVNLRVYPIVLLAFLLKLFAHRLVGRFRERHWFISLIVHALPELAAEKLHSHNTEDEPEHEAN